MLTARESRQWLGLANRAHLLSYGVAVLFTTLALVVTLLVEPLLKATPSPLFFAAVTTSAWFGGLGPGLLATLLSALALEIAVLAPEGRLDASAGGILHVGAFVLVAILISTLNDRRRRAEERASRAAARLKVLADASRAFSAAVPDLPATLEAVARRSAEALGDACVISFRSEDGRWLVPVAWHHLDPIPRALLGQLYTSVRHSADEGLSGRVLQTGQPLLVPTITPNQMRAATKSEYWSYLERFPIHSLLIVPLRARDRVLGTLALSRNTPGRSYTAADQALVQDLADRAALAIDNARLHSYYRHLFEGVAEAIVVADADGRYLDANPAALRLLGYTLEELCRLRFADLVPAGADWVAAEFARHACDGSWQGELELQRKDGALVPVEVVITAIELPSGAVYLAAWHDLSERRALDRLREEFFASVSHDLRTPLTAIRASLGLLELSGDEALNVDQRGLLMNARRNTERLGGLINDLLAFNEIQAGTMAIDRLAVNLRAIVADAMAAVYPLMQQKGQAVELDLPGPMTVEGDPRRLEQVMVNLLANAHQHTPTGTRVTVSGRVAGDEVCLTVQDDGPGIPTAELEAVFQRFYRRAAGDGGSGLGLAIARGLVELHGGRIWAESDPGRGTAFHVALPRHEDRREPCP